MIVADSTVVSEFVRDRPDPAVLRWAEGIGPGELSICVVTVEEIERGLGRMAAGRRRSDLTRRWGRLLDTFAESVVGYDLSAARETAGVLVTAEAAGRPMSLADAQIAGICLAGAHHLATRNVSDFSPVAALTLINPFE